MHTSCFIADSRTVLLLLAINNIIWRETFLHEWQTFRGAKTGQCSVLRTREARVRGGLVERDHRYQYHHDCAQSSSAAEIYPEWTSCHSDTRTSMCRDWRWLALITFKCEDQNTGTNDHPNPPKVWQLRLLVRYLLSVHSLSRAKSMHPLISVELVIMVLLSWSACTATWL